MLTSQNFATMSVPWYPLQHADHVFIVLANSKAWLVSALICCLTIIMLSGRLQAHPAFTMHFSYLCLLENSTLQENKIASNMFTAFSKTLTAGSLTWRSSEMEGEWTTIGENCSPSWSVCVWYVDLQTCGVASWSSIILKKQCVFLFLSFMSEIRKHIKSCCISARDHISHFKLW